MSRPTRQKKKKYVRRTNFSKFSTAELADREVCTAAACVGASNKSKRATTAERRFGRPDKKKSMYGGPIFKVFYGGRTGQTEKCVRRTEQFSFFLRRSSDPKNVRRSNFTSFIRRSESVERADKISENRGRFHTGGTPIPFCEPGRDPAARSVDPRDTRTFR